MRGLVHRQRQNTTLKLLAEKSVNSNINGDHQFIHETEKIQKDGGLSQQIKHNAKINKYKKGTSIFVVPTNKIQEKILAGLLSSNHRTQENDRFNVTRSQRNETLPSNFKSELSNRRITESKFSHVLGKQPRIRESIEKILKKEKGNYELQYLHKRSECNLIQNIQNLRRAERGFVSQDKDQTLELEQKRNFVEKVLSQRLSEQLLSEYTRRKRQIDLMKFKETIKNKLSRRHFYHTLKQKSEVWNKIRVKTHQHSPHHYKLEEDKGLLERTEYPLHYGLTKTHFKKMKFNHLKDINFSFYETNEELRVQSKALELRVQNSKKLRQQNMGRRGKGESVVQSSAIKYKTVGGCTGQLNPEKQVLRGCRNRGQKYKVDSVFVRVKECVGVPQVNVFRELTPWHGDDLQ